MINKVKPIEYRIKKELKKIIREEIIKQFRKKSKIQESSAMTTPVLRQYLETALWASDDENEEGLDRNYDIKDITPETISQAKKDLSQFLLQAKKWLPKDVDMTNVGHDFWLSRNGHGAGFFDADYIEDEKQKKMLQSIAEKFGSIYLYVDENGKVYSERG